MPTLSKRIVLLLILFSFTFQSVSVRGEAIDDKFSQTNSDMGMVHGRAFGKVLMRILLFGSIPKQGVHYMPEGTDLLFGILYAGGYGDQSKLNGITIRRRKVADLINVDLEDVIADGRDIPKLQDGDIVNVPFNWRRSYSEFQFFTGLITAVSSLIISIVALTRKN